MKKIILVTVGLFFIAQFLYAQKDLKKEIDSLILKGRTKVALEKLNQLEDSFEKNEKIASIYYQIDQTKKSIEYYQKALLIKDDYKTKIQLAKSYQKLKLHPKAIDVYESIIEEDPENLLVKYQLGKLYLTRRKANKAIKTFQELYRVDKSNANYSYQKGVAYAMKKQRNEMIDSFLEAYAVDSTHIKSIYQLANSYYKLHDADSTSLFLNKGLALDSTHINLNKLYVNQTYREKEYAKALKVLEKLEKLVPNEIFVINMLGRTHYNLSNHQQSKEYFERSKDIERSNYKTWTYLGHVEMKLKNYRKAKLNYMMATYMGKEKRDEEYYGMGHANLKLNKPLEAIAMFDKAYKEDRGNYKALYQKAKTTDDYYKEKKKAYRLYIQYNLQFENMDKNLTAFVQRRIKEIKKEYFLKGIELED